LVRAAEERRGRDCKDASVFKKKGGRGTHLATQRNKWVI